MVIHLFLPKGPLGGSVGKNRMENFPFGPIGVQCGNILKHVPLESNVLMNVSGGRLAYSELIHQCAHCIVIIYGTVRKMKM